MPNVPTTRHYSIGRGFSLTARNLLGPGSDFSCEIRVVEQQGQLKPSVSNITPAAAGLSVHPIQGTTTQSGGLNIEVGGTPLCLIPMNFWKKQGQGRRLVFAFHLPLQPKQGDGVFRFDLPVGDGTRVTQLELRDL